MFIRTVRMYIPSHVTLALVIIKKCPFSDLEKSRRELAFACGALVTNKDGFDNLSERSRKEHY